MCIYIGIYFIYFELLYDIKLCPKGFFSYSKNLSVYRCVCIYYIILHVSTGDCLAEYILDGNSNVYNTIYNNTCGIKEMREGCKTDFY